MFCRQSGGTIITIDYQTKQRAYKEDVVIRETTLLSVLRKTKWYAFWNHNIFSKKSYRKLLDDKFYELVKRS